MVTGSTDGIGTAFAMELASRGFSLILHGRNASKLSTVKATILKAYPNVKVHVFNYDAKTVEPLSQTDLPDILKGRPLRVLINNVAIGYEAIGPEEIDHHLHVNIRFTTHLTEILMPILISNQPSLIMNIGSDSDMGMPYVSVYSGTKAFLMSWGKGLAETMKDQGHDVEVLGLRISAFVGGENADLEPNWRIPSAEAMARMCLRRVGCGERIVAASLVQGLLRMLLELLPAAMRERIIAGELRERRKGWDKKNI